MKKLLKIKKKAFSLVEILIAVGVFGLISSSVAIFAIDSYRINKNIQQKNSAIFYIQEIASALGTKRLDSWSSIIQNADGTPKKIVFSSNQYQIQNGADSKNGFTIGFTISSVNRDGSGNIVNSGGTQDIHTKAVDINITWQNVYSKSNSLSSKLYLNDWTTKIWTQTTQGDFNLGTNNLTVTTNNSGGEIQMENIGYPDWCVPKVIGNPLDIAGSGVASAVNAEPFKAFVGTQNTANGTSFSRINLTDTHPPTAAIAGTIGNQKINRIWGEGNYIYVSADDDAQEVKIYDVSTSPYTQVGFFNAPGTSNGLGVFALNNKGYLTTADNKLYIFDITSKSGSRTQLGVKDLQGQGSQIKVVGNYAYVSLTNGAAIELQVLDVSNPANIFTTGVGNTSQSDASDIFVNSDGSRAYVGTAASATEKEFIIFDTSSKPGSQSQQYFQESGGQVVIEAENYDSNIARNGKSWGVQTNQAGYTGTGFMQATPDTGTTITSNDYFSTSAELGYKVNFTTTGTYNFWVRAYANNTGNNEVHGGYDGANFPSVQDMSTTSYNQWKWFSGTITISTPEVHWINIWMADDGFRLDKIVLTTSATTPTGNGPAESSRPTGTITVPAIDRQIGQYETNGMSITGVTVVENNTRAILVGTGGEEYQVVDLMNEAAPVRCGGLQVAAGINAVASVKEPDGDSYSYLLTKDTTKEFQIIRGGPGGVGGNGSEEYSPSADFTSSVFDSTSSTTSYISLTWNATVPVNTTIKFQVRCGTTSNLSAQPWLGPDGTSATYFSNSLNSIIPPACINNRYLQYKTYFTSDTLNTPIFNDISINYYT